MIYLRSKLTLGEAVQQLPRDEIIIATKIFNHYNPDGSRYPDLSPDHIVERCEASLKRLRIEAIDLYLLHFFDQLTPLDETLVTEHLVHLSDLTPATTYHYNVMSRDWAGNLTTSGEYTFTTLGLPATFVTGDWDISLTDIDTGEQVAISFSVANVGDLAGSYQISLEINGEVDETKEGTLGAGASKELTFTITMEDAGTYQVTIDGLAFSFTL